MRLGKQQWTNRDMKKVAFSLDNVSLERDGKYILQDLTFTVHDEERWVIFGPNGSGKSTLLGIIGGIYLPVEGSVLRLM